MRKILSFFIFSLALLAMSVGVARAQDCDQEYQCKSDAEDYSVCLNNLRNCWQKQVDKTRLEANTLQSAINIINGQVRIQSLKIQQTVAEIEQLEKEITNLSERIEGLGISLDRLSGNLIKRIRESYKQSRLPYKNNLFAADSFNNFISQYRYINLAQEQTLELMKRTELQRLTYNQQKELKESKQLEVEKLRQELQSQKNILDSQKASKDELLKQTKSNESIYQQKLAEAIAELNSLKAFSSSKGGSVLPEQNSPDGWFFSQRDQRWASYLMGSSNMSIMEVGCLASSVAMIKKKFGEGVNPVTIASNNSYFFSNTAYMLRPWAAPSGYRYQHYAYSQSTLDSKLNENPVIVKLSAGPYGTHFLVIKEKKDGNYIMHDPWEGYDKKFTDFYSLGQIREIGALVKN
jgi:peptidoglycan hydrolase CwlO-like protein